MSNSEAVDSFGDPHTKTAEELETFYCTWENWALDKQLPPPGDWTTWLLMGGRGSGKTRAGAEWVRSLAAQEIGPIALVGETMTEAISIMVRGESGILNVHPDATRPTLRGQRLLWPNGVEAMVMSASDPDRFRGPQFAAAWCDELGCGAVDKGANQPNIFGDPKSGESGRPYFSRGTPDPLIQRQVLRAHQAHWRDPANNPAGMVDVNRIYHWTWDARPYPAFPAQTSVWSDGPNHRNGHWLTGRLGGLASDELASVVAAEHGVPLGAEAAAPFITGYVLGNASKAREALEPVMAATGLSLRNKLAGLHLGLARRAVATTFDAEALVDGEAPVLSRRRGDPAEAPGRLALTYQDRERDYLNAAVTALVRADGPLVGETTALTLDASSARLAAERMLDARAAQRETLELALPPSALALEPGDLVSVAGLAEGPFEISEIRDGLERRITAHTLAANVAVATGVERSFVTRPGVTVRAIPLVVVAHLPPVASDPLRSRLLLAAHAQPWSGGVQVVDDMTGANVAELTRRGLLGSLVTGLPVGPLAVWDRGANVEIAMLAGHLASADDLAVLAGSNRLAVESDDGQWEVIGFAGAELIGPARYRLTRLLRGQAGTAPSLASAGRRVMVLDGRNVELPVESQWLGETRDFRIYAGPRDLEGAGMSVMANAAPALPLAPVHLRARRNGGDVLFSWTRRSRADGDGWGVAEAPLDLVPERYRLTIWNGASMVRAVESTVPALAYPASQQVSDFGGLPDSFSYRIAQVSAALGSGHEAEGVFHV